MRKFQFVLILFLVSLNTRSQELNCRVSINATEIGVSNRQIFTTLQTAISDYMNNTKWTGLLYGNNEKIDCILTLNIFEVISGSQFSGSLQLLVSRPVYDSTYLTPILSFNDNDISFSYEEYEPLIYNENTFTSNLVSILTFYAYTIIGFEADSFSYKGGENFFKSAEQAVFTGQQGGASGWKRIDGNNTRYQLNENLLSPVYDEFRSAMYIYHMQGLDRMVENSRDAKIAISKSIIGFESLYDERPNTFLIRVFMDTKGDEIVDIFSDGPRIETTELREVLSKIFPSFDPKWKQIKI